MNGRLTAITFGALLFGCTPAEDEQIDTTVILTVENLSGYDLWYFQYAGCNSSTWDEVLGPQEVVPHGTFVSSPPLPPGCYDLYIEDELGCWSESSTGVDLGAGLEYVWTALDGDFTC